MFVPFTQCRFTRAIGYLHVLVRISALVLVLIATCTSGQVLAQCDNDNTLLNDPLFAGGVVPLTCPGGREVVCIRGGEYVNVSVEAGNSYTFSTCGNTWDTQLSLFSSTGDYLADNDNYAPCGLQSQITWLADFTGEVSLVLDESYCGWFTLEPTPCCTLSVTCTPPNVEMCYTMTETPYLADPYVGTPITLSDDSHSGVVNIGFPFCFNGVTYTQCVISSNNYVTFDLWKANTYSPWVTEAVPRPSPTQPQNAVLNPWQDIHPGLCGAPCIFYQTLGVAPYRRFVVSYLNVPMYSCTSQRYTSQTVLYESTNCIGSYILSKPVCSSWNGGRAVHGLQNAGGSIAPVVAGRNNTVWTASAMGMFYVPTCWPCSTAVTAACISTVLPIELLSFRGTPTAEGNRLEWSTASEQNTHEFSVERSADGTHFIPVGFVPAAGYSHTPRNYEFFDASPPWGVNYYRLRTIDRDGSYSLSETIPLVTLSTRRPRVYPVPATDLVTVDLPEGMDAPATLQVYDATGRLLRSYPTSSSTTVLDLGHLARGIFFLGIEGYGTGSTTILVLE